MVTVQMQWTTLPRHSCPKTLPYSRIQAVCLCEHHSVSLNGLGGEEGEKEEFLLPW